MNKHLLAIMCAATVAHAANYDFYYIQERSDGKREGLKVQLTPGTFLSVDDAGKLQVQTSAAFRAAIGAVTAPEAADAAPVQSVAGKTGAVVLTSADVGLGSVNNTSDANKPVSTATQIALNAKEPSISAGTTSQYWRGDKSWQPVSGLPVSTATQAALDGKVPTSRTVAAGTGLSGGGNLGSDVTLSLSAGAARANLSGGSGTLDLSNYTLPLPSDVLRASTDLLITPAAMGSLRAVLEEAKLSTSFQVVGDSTAAGSSNWPALFLNWLAASYPGYTVRRLDYDGATHLYSQPVTVQTGTIGSGGRRWEIPSTSTGYAPLVPASSFTLPTGVIDIRIRIRLDALSAASTRVFLGQDWPKLAISVGLTTDNKLRCVASTTGVEDYAFVSSTAISQSVGTVFWARILFTPGSPNSTVDFSTSSWSGVTSDGATWTALGAQQSVAANIVLNNTTTYWYIGSNGNPPYSSAVYAVEMRNGAGGPNVLPWFIDAWKKPFAESTADGITLGGPPELWLINSSVSGWSTGNHLLENQAVLFPNFRQRFVIINHGHNQDDTGSALTTKYESLISNMRTYLGSVPRVIFCTQNPRIGTTGGTFNMPNNQHYQQRYDLLAWAPGKGYGVVDTYRAFLLQQAAGVDLTTLIGGIHPNSSGQALMATVWQSAYQFGNP